MCTAETAVLEVTAREVATFRSGVQSEGIIPEKNEILDANSCFQAHLQPEKLTHLKVQNTTHFLPKLYYVHQQQGVI